MLGPFADRKRSFYFWKNPETGCSLPGWAGLWVGTGERTAAASLPARGLEGGRGGCASRGKVSRGGAGAELRALRREKPRGRRRRGHGGRRSLTAPGRGRRQPTQRPRGRRHHFGLRRPPPPPPLLGRGGHGGRGVTPGERGLLGAMGTSPRGTNRARVLRVRAIGCSFSQSRPRSRPRCRADQGRCRREALTLTRSKITALWFCFHPS